MKELDEDFIEWVEKQYFRTNEDTGANTNALLIWNLVRKHAGLPHLGRHTLPAHCKTHDRYHVIQAEYGCERTRKDP